MKKYIVGKNYRYSELPEESTNEGIFKCVYNS